MTENKRRAGRTVMTDGMRRAVGRPPKRREAKDPGLSLDSGAPEMPESLESIDEAAAEWRRIVPPLLSLNRLADVDGQSLAAFCLHYALWQRSVAPILRDGNDLTGTDETGRERPCTVLMVAIKHATKAVELARKFGLTARTRYLAHASGAGRPAVPDELHEIRGNPSKKKLRGSVSTVVGGDGIIETSPPPGCLGEAGTKEFNRLRSLLIGPQLFTALDVPIVAIAAGTFAIVAEATCELKNEAMELPTKGGRSYEHPLSYLVRRAMPLLEQIWADYGMTPVDRKRFGERKVAKAKPKLKVFVGKTG